MYMTPMTIWLQSLPPQQQQDICPSSETHGKLLITALHLTLGCTSIASTVETGY